MDVYATNNDWKGCKFVQVQANRELPDGTWTKSSKWKWLTVDKVIGVFCISPRKGALRELTL